MTWVFSEWKPFLFTNAFSSTDLCPINAAKYIRETGNGMEFLPVCILCVYAWHAHVVIHVATQGK